MSISPTIQQLAGATFMSRPITPYAEALRLHLLARAAAVEVEAPTILQQPLADRVPTVAWGAAFDALVTELIPRFVDPANSDGQWSAWSEATLLAAIGHSERHMVVATSPLAAAWGEQQAAILARLSTTAVPYVVQYADDLRAAGGDIGEPFADVIARFGQAAWSPYSGLLAPCHFAYEEQGFFMIQRRRSSFIYELPAGLKSWELYLRFTAPGSRPVDLYENADYPGLPDQWSLVDSQPALTSETWLEITIGDIEPVTVSEPAPESMHGWLVSDHRLVIHHHLA